MFNTSDIIRKLMIDKKMTVTKLADKIGIKQQALSRKLQNQNEEYKIEYLENVVNGMGCHIVVNIVDSESQEILYSLIDSE